MFIKFKAKLECAVYLFLILNIGNATSFFFLLFIPVISHV